MATMEEQRTAGTGQPSTGPANAGAATDLPAAALPLEPDRSAGELAGAVSKDLGDLVGMHIALAKAELKEEVTQSAKAAELLGIGAFAGYMTVIMASLGAAWVLAEWLPTWAGLLIVAAVWGIAAGIMVLLGKARLARIQAPEATMAVAKGDVAWAQQQRS